MPALEIATSTVPNALATLSTPALTSASIGDVHFDPDHGLGVAQLAGGRLGGVDIDVRDGHATAGFDEALGDAVADAAASAGDDRDLAIERHRKYSSVSALLFALGFCAPAAGPSIRM